MNPLRGQSRSNVAPPVEVLLRHLIDYAGLFPPAALDMRQAVANYDAYLRSGHSWMLGRLIVPAARLSEFEGALRERPAAVAKPWELSVLIGAELKADVERVAAFNRAGCAIIESVEAKTTVRADVNRSAQSFPRSLTVFCEVPLDGRERDCIAAIAECGLRAKIRTGGETADKFPDSAQVVAFMKLCLDAGVSFKATAGLHHPVRSVHRLTYEPDSPSALMHGFLNVFLAAAFLRAGMDPPVAAELLEERSADAIRFGSDGIEWRERRLSADAIASARRDFSISFGSCSFTEPVDDLQSLGLL
jgi:hypothetical protein